MTAQKFLLLICSIIFVPLIDSENRDYYWKSFDGTIPEDALIGTTNFGYNEYIGRGPVASSAANGLFVGPIIPGSSSIYLATGNGVYTLTEHLEILSSNKPCNIKWVSTNSTYVPLLSGLITAGYYFDKFDSFYIGRIMVRDQEYTIGHVSPRSDFNLLYLNGSVHSTSTTFEILTYSLYPSV